MAASALVIATARRNRARVSMGFNVELTEITTALGSARCLVDFAILRGTVQYNIESLSKRGETSGTFIELLRTLVAAIDKAEEASA